MENLKKIVASGSILALSIFSTGVGLRAQEMANREYDSTGKIDPLNVLLASYLRTASEVPVIASGLYLGSALLTRNPFQTLQVVRLATATSIGLEVAQNLQTDYKTSSNQDFAVFDFADLGIHSTYLIVGEIIASKRRKRRS